MHAVLITAYKDFASLQRLVRRLDRGFFKIYIHLDRRSPIAGRQIKGLQRLGAFVIRRYYIRWGTLTHLYAMLDLLREALRRGGVDYVHLISGQDYPICDLDEFRRRCDGRIFMEFSPLSAESDYINDRYRQRNFFYFLQLGSRVSNRLHRLLDGPSRWLQKQLRMSRKRFGPFDALSKGTIWMSFPAAAAAELLHDPTAAKFLRAIRTTYLPEEIFFQTYFLNSGLRGSVENDNLRYVDWRHRNGSVPAFLDRSDLRPILRSNALFARKVNSEISSDLLDEIDAACFDGPDQREAVR